MASLALEAKFWIIVEDGIEELLGAEAGALLTEQKYWEYFKETHKAGSLGEQKLYTRPLGPSYFMRLLRNT